MGSSPIVHHSEHPSFTARVQGDSHSFASLGMDDNSHFLASDFGFWALCGAFCQFLLLRVCLCLWCVPGFHLLPPEDHIHGREAQESAHLKEKLEAKIPVVWKHNQSGQEGLCCVNQAPKPDIPRHPEDSEHGDGLLGQSWPHSAASWAPKEDGKKKRNSHQTLLFGIALTDHISW